MIDQLLLTNIFEGTDRSNMCMCYNFDATGSGKLGDQHIGGPRPSKVGSPWRLRLGYGNVLQRGCTC